MIIRWSAVKTSYDYRVLMGGNASILDLVSLIYVFHSFVGICRFIHPSASSIGILCTNNRLLATFLNESDPKEPIQDSTSSVQSWSGPTDFLISQTDSYPVRKLTFQSRLTASSNGSNCFWTKFCPHSQINQYSRNPSKTHTFQSSLVLGLQFFQVPQLSSIQSYFQSIYTSTFQYSNHPFTRQLAIWIRQHPFIHPQGSTSSTIHPQGS